MNILELFAGSRSVGKVAEELGHKVFSVDVKDFEGINLVKDIEFLEKKDIPFKPNFIWASPPCTTYSVMTGVHRDKITKEPWTDFAEKSDRLVKKTLKIIKEFNCIYFIENPRGSLRKMDFMLGLPRTTIWYCKYGDKRAKPTDLWSNNIYSLFNTKGFIPKTCFNNNKKCQHEPSPRGSRTGTQGLKNNYERSKIPPLLCKEIIQSI